MAWWDSFDLTERKRAEAERARTEFLTRLVFAQEDERRRIAREMHDQFGEQLTALALRIRALKDACGDREDWRAHVESIEAIAQRLDRDVDTFWELRQTALDDLGLRAAWRTTCRLAEPHRSRPTSHVGNALRADSPATPNDALSNRQEALTNVASTPGPGTWRFFSIGRRTRAAHHRGHGGLRSAGGRDAHRDSECRNAGAGRAVGAMVEIESSPGKGTTGSCA